MSDRFSGPMVTVTFSSTNLSDRHRLLVGGSMAFWRLQWTDSWTDRILNSIAGLEKRQTLPSGSTL
jgi:hypothetical protein